MLTILLVLLTLPVAALTVYVVRDGTCFAREKVVMVAILCGYILACMISGGVFHRITVQTPITVPINERQNFHQMPR